MDLCPPALSTATRPRSGDVAAWVARLGTELERRIAVLVAEMRRTEVEPGLKSVVITDDEADTLLDGPAVAAQDMLPEAMSGSLAAALRGWKALSTLQRRFELSPFEVDVLLTCLAPDLERRFGRLFAYLNDDISRTRPGTELLLRLLAPRTRHLALQAALAADAPLRAMGLLQDEDAARGGEQFRVADGVLRQLLGRPGWDARLERVLVDEPADPMTQQGVATRPEASLLRQRLQQALAARAPGQPVLVHVRGRSGSGRLQLARSAASALGLGLLALDARRLSRPGADFEGLLLTALRDAHQQGAALLLHDADALFEDAERAADLRLALARWLAHHDISLWFVTEGVWPVDELWPAARCVELHLPELGIEQRRAAWCDVLAQVGAPAGPATAELALQLATKFRTHHREIARAARHALGSLAAAAAASDTAAWSVALHQAAAAVAAPRLHRLATRVATRHELGDLVMPPEKHEVLRDLIRRVRHRRQVMEHWGFEQLSARGRGLVVLFHGPSGTGKTMAVDAIAHTLGMALFRIDLAGVVSKYIGETEKNLRAIFDEADRADAVLLFDEADALFGKRSEVKDAHDRYANIEINYLLQRIESFEGIAVLATNKPGHLDEAFQRRIHVTLEFALPREGERAHLWRRSFPAAAPLAADVDWSFVARRFELAGGTIRNAALSAAYLAAEAGGAIGQRELMRALRTELTKLGRRVADSEFGPYQALLAPTAGAAVPPPT